MNLPRSLVSAVKDGRAAQRIPASRSNDDSTSPESYPALSATSRANSAQVTIAGFAKCQIPCSPSIRRSSAAIYQIGNVCRRNADVAGG